MRRAVLTSSRTCRRRLPGRSLASVESSAFTSRLSGSLVSRNNGRLSSIARHQRYSASNKASTRDSQRRRSVSVASFYSTTTSKARLSTEAAAEEEADPLFDGDVDSLDVKTDERITTSSSSPVIVDRTSPNGPRSDQRQGRPRLQALRRQLSLEETSDSVNAPAPPRVTKTKAQSASVSKNDADASSPTDLRALAAQITLPDHVTTNDPSRTVQNNKLANNPIILTDPFRRFHSYLRLSLTERCNLRCTYCMPEAGVPLQPASHLLTTPELLQLAQYFSNWGVTKFRLTGGEPTLRRDLVDVVAGLSDILQQQQPSNNNTIGMTTNGIVLSKLLPSLVDAGLGSVNLSLDTLDAAKFENLTRRPAAYLDRVWQALETACRHLVQDENSSSSTPVKVNCVVMRGVNDDEVPDFVALTSQFPGLAVRFIEYMPFTENGWNQQSLVPAAELRQRLEREHGVSLRALPVADPHDTTVWYTTETGRGKVGFITSMTSQFCAGCNRLRLSADGHIKVCLFENSVGTQHVSLRDALRQGLTSDEISKLVYAALQRKQWALGGHATPQDISDHAVHNKPMTLIGG